jgi:cardiolipin hydrolase
MSATTPKRTSKHREASAAPSRPLLPFEVIESNPDAEPAADTIFAPQEFQFADALFSRTKSIAEVLEGLIASTKVSIDAALHRFNSQRLGRVLEDAHSRGVRIRLLTDRSKFEKSEATRTLLANCQFPFRLTYGRGGEGSKMHHKFVLMDDALVITGSYNWTFASEDRNHENVILLRETRQIGAYHDEFEALWASCES